VNTTSQWLAWAEHELAPVSDAARLEAELLFAEVSGGNRASVIAHPEGRPQPPVLQRYRELVGRRAQGEPFAYLTGQREFYSLTLAVDANVLVPRADTELLVELALGQRPRSGARVLDLGTGSGAIALALKAQRPDLDVVAVDTSATALAVARANADRLSLAVRFVRSDWFAALEPMRFDLIVSNPPYVASGDAHLAGALRHEPQLALDGGADGLDACRKILASADAYLQPDGRLLFEHGFDQRDGLVALAASRGYRLVDSVDDLAGHPRAVAFARQPDEC
jgi:release factor glutamine methyltransferase